MENLTDNELIDKIRAENDSEAAIILLKRHAALYTHICKRFHTAFEVTGKKIADVIEDQNYVFIKSVNSFNPNANTKFSTWYSNNIRFHCLDLLDNKKFPITIPIDSEESISKIKELVTYAETGDNKNYLLSMINQFNDERVKTIFNLRYFNEDNEKLSWSEIGKQLGITAQAVINIHEKALKILKEKLTSREIVDII